LQKNQTSWVCKNVIKTSKFIKVSMLGPSPDWIVGVSGLELCHRNCSWADSKELFLYPWDTGVDDGISYESPDSPTSPQQPITRFEILLTAIDRTKVS